MMNLEVYNEQNKLVCKLDEDCNLLGSYPLEDNMRLHVGGSDHFE
jgi:tubulin-folding cofactor B